VVADVDRVAAAQRAADGGATVAVLDDGFQHRRLRRDVDVVLLAAEDDFPAQLLPWDPYREPIQSLGRAHAVIVTRRTSGPDRAEAVADTVAAEFPHLVVGRVFLCAALWQTLAGEPAEAPKGPLLVVTAIAKPEAFRDNVAEVTGADVELAWYADHHEYTADEVREIRSRAGGRTLVVTAKDAVKFQAFSDLLPDTRVLAQEVRWEAEQDRLCALVRGEAGGKA
jgi:tetraacyldisaccharide 4'-kinase